MAMVSAGIRCAPSPRARQECGVNPPRARAIENTFSIWLRLPYDLAWAVVPYGIC